MENQTSMLPQPSARATGSVMRALSDLSESENNARATMPPPSSVSTTGLKRQGSNLPEPAQKRKILADRAGEVMRPQSQMPRPASAASQNASNASTLYRSTSNASSLSRSTSVSSRNALNASYTGSLNSGIRPPSSIKAGTNTARPKSSYGTDRTFGAASKPSRSLADLQASHEAQASKKLFDDDEQYNNFKRMFEDYKQMHQDAMQKIDSEREQNNIYREQMTQLDKERSSQTDSIILLKTEKSTLQYQLESTEASMKQLKKEYEQRLEELRNEHRTDLDALRDEHRKELERLKNDHREELRELKLKHEQELDQERSQRVEALSQVSTQTALEKQRHEMDLARKDQETAAIKLSLEHAEAALEREKQVNNDLRETLKTAGDNASSMEATRQGLQAKIAYLESDSKSQSEAYAAMAKRMNEAIAKSDAIEEKLRKEETLRRRLHNQVQELKGNIRVFCRVRPTLTANDDMAKMKFPDPEESTEIEVRGLDEKNSLGKDVTKTHPFSFDRVFDPSQTNDDVFGEISQLIQSALDGYNVCIFAYGQTGSGKTYTMSSEDGMIPRALRQIYSTSKELEDRGWKYSMQGSFVEVYNEELRDLLGDDREAPKKHEIHHDIENQETTISNVTTLSLDNREQVESILSQAMSRRSVAATKANEHSSRSHSVFILKLVGNNSITGEQSKGTLNLVDLAGSERIKNAETSGQRLKETQSINKSLSCLGDVIGALGQGQAAADGRGSLNGGRESFSTAHIPYRNSKLTYLLQLSLGGNCKTLMFVMVAPEKKCLSETITSLKFAEKVSRTRVGVAKKTK